MTTQQTTLTPTTAPTLPTLEQVHAYLKAHYKHERFEGRDNDPKWLECEPVGVPYSQVVAASALADLTKYGESLISRHETTSGTAHYYTTADVLAFNPDPAPVINFAEAAARKGRAIVLDTQPADLADLPEPAATLPAPNAWERARHISLADTAKEIRKALKAAFPGVKFSVRGSKYSGGASISVTWTDGPTWARVEAIVGQFKRATFNSMEDLQEYHTSTFNGELVSWGADYVSATRDLSATLLQRAAQAVADEYGGAPVAIITDKYGAHIDTRDYRPAPDGHPGWIRETVMRRAHEME